MLIFDVGLYPRISMSNSHGKTSKYMDAVTMFQKLTQKVNEPKMTFDPTSVEVSLCDSIQGIILSKSHENMSKYVDTVTPFFKKLEPKVKDP